MKKPAPGLQILSAVVLTAALAGCDKIKDATGLGGPAGPSAESMGHVRIVRLETNSCESGIRAGLGERGFSTTKSQGTVDAVLTVSVSHSGRNLDNLPSFGGVGNRAGYSATVKGKGGKVLFSTSGDEGSINMNELCQDIGDEIGSRMKARRG